jgi:C4-dicarboxylate-specific signal transduction histidine kinase
MRDRRASRSSWRVHAALILLSAAMMGAMIYGLRTGTRMSREHPPLLIAAMEIQLAGTTAHLWFEEILSGDRHESMADVWRLLDVADTNARAILAGSDVGDRHLPRLDDPVIREQIEDVRRHLAEFRRITEERWAARGSSAPGTAIDQRYDRVFLDFIELAQNATGRIERHISDDVRLFRRLLTALIAATGVLAVFVGLVFSRYIRQRRRAEEESREHRQRLEHLSRVSTLGEMATGIAHEINQPLTAIASYAQACGRILEGSSNSNGQLMTAVSRIGEQAVRAGEVIRRLRSLVRRHEIHRVPCDMNALVREVASLAGGDAALHGVGIRLELARSLPGVLVDPVQIQQVVLNLVRNGMDAMRDARSDPSLIIRTAAADDGVTVAVVDHGEGISDETARSLFQPFYTTKETGMGMGLPISRSILIAHGGKMWFTRNPGNGTTFHFSLPSVRGRTDGE